MDEKTRLASLMVLHFGAPVVTAPTSPEAITSASDQVYDNYLSRVMKGIGPHPAKTTLVEDTHASLYQFVTDLETDPLIAQDVKVSQANFDARHDTWCLNTMATFMALPHVRSGKPFTFTYGHAQKWINMTLKYLAVLGHPTVLDVYLAILYRNGKLRPRDEDAHDHAPSPVH